MPSNGWGWPSNAGRLSAPPLTTRPRRAMPGLIVYLHQEKNPRASLTGVFAWPSAGSSARCTRWTRLDSRLRGNDAVWCGEGFFVAHEPLYFNVMGTQPQPLRRALSAALTARAKTPRPPGCSQPGGRVFLSPAALTQPVLPQAGCAGLSVLIKPPGFPLSGAGAGSVRAVAFRPPRSARWSAGTGRAGFSGRR